jgi:hypothetical protein
MEADPKDEVPQLIEPSPGTLAEERKKATPGDTDPWFDSSDESDIDL